MIEARQFSSLTSARSVYKVIDDVKLRKAAKRKQVAKNRIKTKKLNGLKNGKSPNLKKADLPHNENIDGKSGKKENHITSPGVVKKKKIKAKENKKKIEMNKKLQRKTNGEVMNNAIEKLKETGITNKKVASENVRKRKLAYEEYGTSSESSTEPELINLESNVLENETKNPVSCKFNVNGQIKSKKEKSFSSNKETKKNNSKKNNKIQINKKGLKRKIDDDDMSNDIEETIKTEDGDEKFISGIMEDLESKSSDDDNIEESSFELVMPNSESGSRDIEPENKGEISDSFKSHEENEIKSNIGKLFSKEKTKKKNFKNDLSKDSLSTVFQNWSLFSRMLDNDYSNKNRGSDDIGNVVFEWLLGTFSLSKFFKKYWEKDCLLIKAEQKKRFKGLFSTEELDNILRENSLLFTKNIDLTTYKDGVRETLNPEGRALASVIWDYYNSGCSVRFLNPQTYSHSVWDLLSKLQEYFNSFCGANVYLTPPGTQGFAPHWDDIEAFILQLEGKKRWRVYKPRNSKETLPRYSSRNFGPNDPLGLPILDCVLEPGDLLYFPRGFIHQAEALDCHHSLHITISTYQKNTWADLLEKLLPAALAAASKNDVEFRQGLPLPYLKSSGVVFSDKKTDVRKLIQEKVYWLVSKMMESPPIDAAVDQMAKSLIHDSLPPNLTEVESNRTIFEGGERWCPARKLVVNDYELEPVTKIRLLRRGCVRLIVEENSVRLYHSVENSREYHADDPKYVEIEAEVAPGVEFLIKNYPAYTTIENLPLSNLEDKMVLAAGLWEKGLISMLKEFY